MKLTFEQHLEPYYDAAGTAYASSTTITDVNPTPNPQLYAGQLRKGTMIEMHAYGTFSNTGTPTLILGFYYGAVAGTALVASSAVTTTTAATNWAWVLHYEGQVRSEGATGTIMGHGVVEFPTSLTAFTPRRLPETALATVTIDTTVAKALTVGATWGSNSASNTLTCHGFRVSLRN